MGEDNYPDASHACSTHHEVLCKYVGREITNVSVPAIGPNRQMIWIAQSGTRTRFCHMSGEALDVPQERYSGLQSCHVVFSEILIEHCCSEVLIPNEAQAAAAPHCQAEAARLKCLEYRSPGQT